MKVKLIAKLKSPEGFEPEIGVLVYAADTEDTAPISITTSVQFLEVHPLGEEVDLEEVGRVVPPSPGKRGK